MPEIKDCGFHSNLSRTNFYMIEKVPTMFSDVIVSAGQSKPTKFPIDCPEVAKTSPTNVGSDGDVIAPAGPSMIKIW